jgi:type II secretory ATPase GspE/PulE/Tfp pilus assembly ATPase PilB-like protein
MDGDIKDNVFCLDNISPEKLRDMAAAKIKSKLHKEAMKLVLQGVTSYNEVKNID